MNRKLYFFILFLIFTFSLSAQNNNTVLEFDGDDSFFINDRDNLLDIPVDDWTIECWVFPTTNTVPAIGTFPAIISRKYSFELYFRNNGGTLGFGIIALSGSTLTDGFDIEASRYFTGGMMLNKWHHIAVSSELVSGTRTTRLFLDGNLEETSTDSDFSLDASISAITFGNRYSGGTNSRYIDDCAMDEIAYSNTARYTSSFSITTWSAPHTIDASTIFYFDLDEGSGTTVVDSSSNALNTTLRGSPNTPTWRAWNYFAEDLPLPVEYFEPLSVKRENNSSILKWSTATETNNEGFNIERSIDNNNWNRIAFIQGANNSNIIRNYQYIDEYPNEINYYRLKQVDFDGKESISESVYLSFDDKEFLSNSDIEIYPIPANDKLFIDTDELIELIELRDISGQYIKELECTNNTINTSQLNRGTYLLSIKLNGKFIVKKLIIVN